MTAPGVLWAHAAAVEGAGLDLAGGARVELGVGKVSAAARLAREVSRGRPELVVLFGVAGAYPQAQVAGAQALAVGALCVVAETWLADEGVDTEAGFLDLSALGLGCCGPWAADPTWTARIAERLGGLQNVRGATVSTCSGTDGLSRARALRTGAAVETMESAAVAAVCREFGVPWVEVRCISNHTGDREHAGWALAPAVATLHAALGGLARGWPW